MKKQLLRKTINTLAIIAGVTLMYSCGGGKNPEVAANSQPV